MILDEDVSKALVKMERIDAIAATLPGLDCGACGSPNCRALAEDIIRGAAFDTDCVIKLRERVKTLAEEILDLARKLPGTMANEEHTTGNRGGGMDTASKTGDGKTAGLETPDRIQQREVGSDIGQGDLS